METIIDFIVEGLKKFAGEIIGTVMLVVFLWAFPSFRSLFNYKNKSNNDKTKHNDSESQEDIQKELDILRNEEEELIQLRKELKRKESALSQIKNKTAYEIQERAEIQRQIEAQRREEKRVKEDIQRQQEALRQAEARKAEEARQKAEIERKREEQRREQERIKAELQRKQEELKQAELQKAQATKRREEAQRQLETQQQKELETKKNIPQRQSAEDLYREGYELFNRGGNPHNFIAAERFLKKAAELGHAQAQYMLAEMYRVGWPGVEENQTESEKWYRKAAELGHSGAQYMLALFCEARKNYYEALKWYKILNEKSRDPTQWGAHIREIQSLIEYEEGRTRSWFW